MKEAKHKLKRIDRVGENYELSRWVPLVKDVAEVSFGHFCKFYSEKWEELVGGCHNRSKKFYTWRISLPPEFHAMLFVSFRKVLHMENFSPPGISRHVASFIVFLCSLPPLSVLCISLSFDSLPHPPQHAVNGRLDESYAPFIRKPRSSSSSASGWSSGTSASSAAGITTTSVRQRWNWIPTQRGGGVDKEVRSLD